MDWKPRPRKYQNGKRYWVVGRERDEILTTDGFTECRYSSRETAQAEADKQNKK
jgi:hypothetical protein